MPSELKRKPEIKSYNDNTQGPHFILKVGGDISCGPKIFAPPAQLILFLLDHYEPKPKGESLNHLLWCLNVLPFNACTGMRCDSGWYVSVENFPLVLTLGLNTTLYSEAVFFKDNLWDRSQILWARENQLDSTVS